MTNAPEQADLSDPELLRSICTVSLQQLKNLATLPVAAREVLQLGMDTVKKGGNKIDPKLRDGITDLLKQQGIDPAIYGATFYFALLGFKAQDQSREDAAILVQLIKHTDKIAALRAQTSNPDKSVTPPVQDTRVKVEATVVDIRGKQVPESVDTSSLKEIPIEVTNNKVLVLRKIKLSGSSRLAVGTVLEGRLERNCPQIKQGDHIVLASGAQTSRVSKITQIDQGYEIETSSESTYILKLYEADQVPNALQIYHERDTQKWENYLTDIAERDVTFAAPETISTLKIDEKQTLAELSLLQALAQELENLKKTSQKKSSDDPSPNTAVLDLLAEALQTGFITLPTSYKVQQNFSQFLKDGKLDLFKTYFSAKQKFEQEQQSSSEQTALEKSMEQEFVKGLKDSLIESLQAAQAPLTPPQQQKKPEVKVEPSLQERLHTKILDIRDRVLEQQLGIQKAWLQKTLDKLKTAQSNKNPDPKTVADLQKELVGYQQRVDNLLSQVDFFDKVLSGQAIPVELFPLITENPKISSKLGKEPLSPVVLFEKIQKASKDQFGIDTFVSKLRQAIASS